LKQLNSIKWYTSLGFKTAGQSFTLGPNDEAIAISDSYIGYLPELLYDRIIRKLNEQEY